MLETVQVASPSDPQAVEFRVEHPGAPTLPNDQCQADTGDFLIVSPYIYHPHLLNLKTLDLSQQLLARALTNLESVRQDYATAPYTDSFNWPSVFTHLKTQLPENGHIWKRQHFYIVVFRSQIPPTTNRIELGELDQRSHAEATKSGGLLKYWFGVPDTDGRNLATCIWRQQSDTRPASTGPGHQCAARATVSLYTEWRIERLRLVIGDDVDEWDIVPWED